MLALMDPAAAGRNDGQEPAQITRHKKGRWQLSIVLFGLADKGEINMEQLTFRKARPEDLAQVFALFTDAIHTMDKDGIPQWDEEVYPDERTLKEDIEHGQMYLAELEERPAAVFVLNLEYDPQYANGVWAEPDSFWCSIGFA